MNIKYQLTYNIHALYDSNLTQKSN